MDKKTKIIIGILITLIIIIILVVLYRVLVIIPNENTTIDTYSMQDTNNITEKTEENQTENEIAENEINGNNTEEEVQNTNITEQTQQNTQNQVTGKEEQESNQENNGINKEQKAIELAKKAWGENSDAYTFSIDYIEGNIYHVQVISNAQTIGYFDVNMETEEVKEITN